MKEKRYAASGVDIDAKAAALARASEATGSVSFEEMHRVINMGIGMVLLVAPERAQRAAELLTAGGQPHDLIGSVVAGSRRVKISSA